MSSNFTVRLRGDEATRKERGRSTWLLERNGAELGQIVHQHSAERRRSGAWFTVWITGHALSYVHSRDFGDALRFAAELLEAVRRKAQRRAKRSKGGAR